MLIIWIVVSYQRCDFWIFFLCRRFLSHLNGCLIWWAGILNFIISIFAFFLPLVLVYNYQMYFIAKKSGSNLLFWEYPPISSWKEFISLGVTVYLCWVNFWMWHKVQIHRVSVCVFVYLGYFFCCIILASFVENHLSRWAKVLILGYLFLFCSMEMYDFLYPSVLPSW